MLFLEHPDIGNTDIGHFYHLAVLDESVESLGKCIFQVYSTIP